MVAVFDIFLINDRSLFINSCRNVCVIDWDQYWYLVSGLQSTKSFYEWYNPKKYCKTSNKNWICFAEHARLLQHIQIVTYIVDRRFSKFVDEEYIKLIYSKYITFEYYWIINTDNCSLKVNVTEKLQCVNYKYLKK